MTKTILDVCCGSRMFWFDKNNPYVVFMDKREMTDTLCDGRILEIKPDIVADFKNIPFDDNSFYMVVFDPPHLIRAGETSWIVKKYGRLPETWQNELTQGFNECFRVLKPNGTLIFKWSEAQIKLSDVLNCFPIKPLLGHKRSKTHFLVFYKEQQNDR